MIDWTDRRPPSMVKAALEYALGSVAVLPCHHLIPPSEPAGRPQAPGCWCQRRDCPAPAAHPLGTLAAGDASAGLGAVGSWWLEHPDANIAIPAGVDVDVVEVRPPAAVNAVAAWLGAGGLEAGRVLGAAQGHARLLLPVGAAGAAGGGRVGVVPCGALVLLPPSRLADGRRVGWLVPRSRLRLPGRRGGGGALAGLPAAGDLGCSAAWGLW